MSERVIQTIVRAVFILALLGFGIAFALTSQPVFAGGCVTAALGLISSLFRDVGKDRGASEPPPLPRDLGEDEDEDGRRAGKEDSDADR